MNTDICEHLCISVVFFQALQLSRRGQLQHGFNGYIRYDLALLELLKERLGVDDRFRRVDAGGDPPLGQPDGGDGRRDSGWEGAFAGQGSDTID